MCWKAKFEVTQLVQLADLVIMEHISCIEVIAIYIVSNQTFKLTHVTHKECLSWLGFPDTYSMTLRCGWMVKLRLGSFI